MISGGSIFNDFPENQFAKFRAVQTISRQIGTTAYHALFCSKQDVSVFTTMNIQFKH